MQPERLGPYRISRTLGRGGMGMVYEGVNEETGEPAAVKVLSSTLAADEDFRQRFEGEIETLKKLRHPNIVRLFGFGQEDDLLFYAMELVDGQSLEQELRAGRQFPWREVVRIARDTCGALRHAHDRGVTHRDIKPANLLLDSEGRVKLSDFGIARLFGHTSVTAAGSVLGTIEYMAPEQADAQPAGPRSDLYSLGGVMYALMARRPPFLARSLAEMLDKQRHDRPDRVTRFDPTAPDELADVIAQLLEKDPQRRLPTATVLSRRLEALLALPEDDVPATREHSAEDEFEVGSGSSGGGLAGIDQLARTRLETGPLERPEARGVPALFEEDVPDTKETTAFEDLEKAGRPTAEREVLAAAEDEESREPTEEETPGEEDQSAKTASHFVTVTEEELDAYEPDRPDHRALISPQTWVLALALVLVGVGAWYMLQPPSADTLYQRIVAQTADGTIGSYRRAEDDIREFLTRYSGDSRSEQLREYVTEIELDRLESRFELRAKGLLSTGDLLPIERAYLEAINQARLDPERGVAKLQALVDLYDHRADTSGPTGHCLELARRRLEKLREQLRGAAPDHLALIQSRLDHADQIEAEEPDRAREIRKAVIELYEEKPWAAAAVRRAREGLGSEP